MTLQIDPLLLDVVPASTESDALAKRPLPDRAREPAPARVVDSDKEPLTEAPAGVWGY